MNIRKIQVEDAQNFLEMKRKLDRETKFMLLEPQERRSSAADIEKEIKSLSQSGSLKLVAETGGEIVAFLTARREPFNRIKHSAYIVVGILKDYRGRGIGRGLFEELDRWARETGIKRLELTVMTHNHRAVKLYEGMGFEIEGCKRRSLIVDGEYVDEYMMAKLF